MISESFIASNTVCIIHFKTQPNHVYFCNCRLYISFCIPLLIAIQSSPSSQLSRNKILLVDVAFIIHEIRINEQSRHLAEQKALLAWQSHRNRLNHQNPINQYAIYQFIHVINNRAITNSNMCLRFCRALIYFGNVIALPRHKTRNSLIIIRPWYKYVYFRLPFMIYKHYV